jgi:hypothetical protein
MHNDTEMARSAPGQSAPTHDTQHTPDPFWVGYICGYRQCEADEQAWWSEVARKVRAQADRPSHAELTRRRDPDHWPCGRECGGCSRCIYAEAWRKRGGRPYLGVRHDR